ncbi:MAG: hypothetical protein OHK0029_06240 [Armatimonadaceae bacterium]
MSAVFHAQIERREPNGIPVWLFHKPDVAETVPVIVLHGLNSRKERHLELCLRLADAGLTACAMDLRSHGDRRDDDSPLLLGDRTTETFAGAFGRCVTGTARDLAPLADTLGWETFGVVGHSLGGYVALQAAVNEPRIAALAVLSGAIDVSGTTTDGALLHDIAACGAHFAGRSTLFLHGTADELVPVAGARRFCEALMLACNETTERVALIEYPELGHTLSEEMLCAAVDWMARHLMEANATR